jgi:type I restriction enzyme S subunit
MVTPDVIAMRPNPAGAVREYLLHYLNSDSARRFAFGASYGVTRLRMNLSILRAMPVPLPPREEQLEIGRLASAAVQLAMKQTGQLASLCDRANQLDSAILSNAFRGELVAQDPDDEPASEMLARLAAEDGQGLGASR